MKTRKNDLPHIECLTQADLERAIAANTTGPEYLALVDADDRGWLVTWDEDLAPFGVSYAIGDENGDADATDKVSRLLDDLVYPVVLINTVVDRCNALGGGTFGAPVRCIRLPHAGQHMSYSGMRW